MGVKRGCLMILIREHADYKVKGRQGYQCGGSGSLWIRICQGEIRNLEEDFFVFFRKAIDLTIFLLVFIKLDGNKKIRLKVCRFQQLCASIQTITIVTEVNFIKY